METAREGVWVQHDAPGCKNRRRMAALVQKGAKNPPKTSTSARRANYDQPGTTTGDRGAVDVVGVGQSPASPAAAVGITELTTAERRARLPRQRRKTSL